MSLEQMIGGIKTHIPKTEAPEDALTPTPDITLDTGVTE